MHKLDFMQQQADSLACSITAASREVNALLFDVHLIQQAVLSSDIHMCLTIVLHLRRICSRALLFLRVCT